MAPLWKNILRASRLWRNHHTCSQPICPSLGQHQLAPCAMKVRMSKKGVLSNLCCALSNWTGWLKQFRHIWEPLSFTEQGWVVEEIEPSVESWHLIENPEIQPFLWFTTWVKSLFIWNAGLLCKLVQQAKPSWSSSTMNLCPCCGFLPVSCPLNCIYISSVKHYFIQVSEVKHSLTPCTLSLVVAS